MKVNLFINLSAYWKCSVLQKSFHLKTFSGCGMCRVLHPVTTLCPQSARARAKARAKRQAVGCSESRCPTFGCYRLAQPSPAEFRELERVATMTVLEARLRWLILSELKTMGTVLMPRSAARWFPSCLETSLSSARTLCLLAETSAI